MLLDLLFLIMGFIVIIKSSDFLVDAASSLALRFRIPKMLIALTIVSFGTCAPEVAISFQSVAEGNGTMAFANVIGSCIVNVFLIIGLASFLRPIRVRHATIKKELPLLFLITSIFVVLLTDGLYDPFTSYAFTRVGAIVLILLFMIFVLYLVQMLFHKNGKDFCEDVKIKFTPLWAIAILVVSILFIIVSSDVIVHSAQNIASFLHVSEKVITMFVIVVGTSLPEMFMTVISARRGEFDMAIGNIIGTNIFNICIVLGLPVVIYGDLLLSGFQWIDLIMVFLSSFLLFLFARSERTITKKEGLIMLLLFLGYYVYLLF